MLHRRLEAHTCSALLLSGTILAAGQGVDQDRDRITEVRQALGGDKLAAITGIVLEGDYRRQLGEREISGDLELAIALPDKFLRTETLSFDPANPIRRFSGFNGSTSLDRIDGGGGDATFRTRVPGPDGPGPRQVEMQGRMLQVVKRDFGRILIAFLAGSSSTFPLEYRFGGVAESDDGKADMFEVTGPDAFSARLFVDPQTHVPITLMFRDVMPRLPMMVRMPADGSRPSREEIERRMKEAREAGPPPEVDVQLFLSDYKKVDGVLMPTTIRRAIDGKTVEEWHIKSITINPVFKADKFEKSN